MTRVREELVEAALTGDEDALDRVIASWLPTIYGWCGRLGGLRVDPEEAAHDVIMLLVRRYSAIGGAAQLGSWLFGTCRRVVANHRRRVWYRRWLPGGVPERTAPERADGPLEVQELADEVARTLEHLSTRHREVLVLCYLEERSLCEVSALLGVPEGTVKSRLFHARANFLAAFSFPGPSPGNPGGLR